MRRFKKEIKDKDIIIDVLNRSHVGCMGTTGKDGYPMVKPLNFAYNPPLPPFSKGGHGGGLEVSTSTQQKREKRLRTSKETTGSALRRICQ